MRARPCGSHGRLIRAFYGGGVHRRKEETMRPRLLLVLAAVLAVAALAAGGMAIAAGAGDDDKPLTGATLDKASAAALAHTGGGTVVETETGDDGAAYGVEVRRADGSQVEVSLDESFQVIGKEADDDGAGDDEGGSDD
jgi:hypothetical protein